MELKIVIEIDNEENQLGVILQSYPKFIDNSYDDEYGTVSFPKVPGLEDEITWNKKLYTEAENKIIENYIKYNYKVIEEKFVRLLVEETIPDY
jgi:hypothetical protein